MYKFLKGLPIVLVGLVLFFMPYMIFGEVGMDVLTLILVIVSLCVIAWVIGDSIVNR